MKPVILTKEECHLIAGIVQKSSIELKQFIHDKGHLALDISDYVQKLEKISRKLYEEYIEE